MLASRGYRVYVATRGMGSFNRGSSPTPNYLEIIYVRGHLNIPVISNYIFSRRASDIVNRLSPEVVIINSYWGESSALYIRRAIPKIVLIHDVGLFRSPIARRNLAKHILRVYVLRRVVRVADLIVVPTEAVKRDLILFLNADESKIRVLGFEGVDGPFRRMQIDNGIIDIVQVGRFAPNKGQLVLLDAIESMLREAGDRLNIRVHMVGSLTDKRYYGRVISRAREINTKFGREVVMVRADADDNDIDYFYRLADICVAPSIAEEGFGLTVLECMAYGKPVIASDIFEETGVANRDRAVIVPRGDAKSLARAILELIEKPEKADKISTEGIEYSKAHSWDKVADQFVKYIDEVTNRNR